MPSQTVYTKPFLVRLNGIKFCVDKFSYRDNVRAFFLTHFHSDHYQGLCKRWTYGPVYATEGTVSLVLAHLSVVKEPLIPVRFGVPVEISKVLVTAIPANHCPFSAMFLFEDLTSGKTVLFTGDIRYDKDSPECSSWPTLSRRVYRLILDNTYLDQRYDLPPQEVAIRDIIAALEAVYIPGKTKIICQAYSVGKERVIVSIAKHFDIRFHVATLRKQKLLKLIFAGDYSQFFSDTPDGTFGLVDNLFGEEKRGAVLFRKITASEHHITRCVFVLPTGWTHIRTNTSGTSAVTRFGGVMLPNENMVFIRAPYSEHSSYSELRSFVELIIPQELVLLLSQTEDQNNDLVQKHFGHVVIARNSVLNFAPSVIRVKEAFQPRLIFHEDDRPIMKSLCSASVPEEGRPLGVLTQLQMCAKIASAPVPHKQDARLVQRGDVVSITDSSCISLSDV